jgi:ribosome maturation factor RimP
MGIEDGKVLIEIDGEATAIPLDMISKARLAVEF